MGYMTTEQVLAKMRSDPKYKEQKREIDKLNKDIETARKCIKDALDRYLKTKLRARSKKAATENPFAELDEWESLEAIQEAYGYDGLTDAQYEHLCDLWEAREESKLHRNTDNEYHDRITDMLYVAMRRVGDEYQDEIVEFESMDYDMISAAQKEAREFNDWLNEQEHGGNS